MGGSEREMLIGWLDYHRETLALKCAGLDGEQLDRRAVPPSTLSLAGLVRHLAREETDAARLIISEAEDLTDTGSSGLPLRFWLIKTLNEYARHNGHADLLRERIDGQTGE